MICTAWCSSSVTGELSDQYQGELGDQHQGVAGTLASAWVTRPGQALVNFSM
jgi:hypothetical protein